MLLDISKRSHKFAISLSSLAGVALCNVVLYRLPHAWPPVVQCDQAMSSLCTQVCNIYCVMVLLNDLPY